MMHKLLIATTNKGKVREIAKLIVGVPVEVIQLGDPGLPDMPEAPEEGETFEEIAIEKVVHYGKLSGIPTVAEDAGLEIPILDGWPGIHSSRVAATDSERVGLALERMRGKEGEERTARFVSVAVFYDPVIGVMEIFPGMVYGVLLDAPRGENGFGYDPIFYYEELKKTFAELSTEEKNLVSHRGKSFRKLAEWVREYFSGEEPPEGMGLPFPV